MKYSAKENGFYPSDMNYSLPDDAIDIPLAVYEHIMLGQANGMMVSANSNGFPELSEPFVSMDSLSLRLQRNIAKEADLALSGFLDKYPDSEKLSFGAQEREARAYLSTHGDIKPLTPILEGIATGRGLTVLEVARRVIVKADLFSLEGGRIFGLRKKFTDDVISLHANGDKEALSTFTFSY